VVGATHHQFISRRVWPPLLVVAVAGVAIAQSGRIGGIVHDEQGTPIKGATVLAESVATPPVRIRTTTDESGRFDLVGLTLGSWSLQIDAAGLVQDSITIEVRATPTPPLAIILKKSDPTLAELAAKDVQAALSDADRLYNSQRWDEAVAAYREILVKMPVLTVINLQIANAYRHKGDFDRALAAYDSLLRSDPTNEDAKIGVAMTMLEKGDLESAEHALEAAARLRAATREVFYDLGEVKLSKSKFAEAQAAYEMAIRLDPTWTKPVLGMARLITATGDKKKAAIYLEKVIGLDPYSPEAAQARAALARLKK
jgi:tetratricopeptide (TPR) repeat protein